MLAARRSTRFYGWRVVWAAFTLAVFGWGVGFYGPPVFLHAVHAGRGWPLALVSAAVTLHFLVGAVSVTNLPALHRRFGVAWVTKLEISKDGVPSKALSKEDLEKLIDDGKKAIEEKK